MRLDSVSSSAVPLPLHRMPELSHTRELSSVSFTQHEVEHEGLSQGSVE